VSQFLKGSTWQSESCLLLYDIVSFKAKSPEPLQQGEVPEILFTKAV